MGCAMGLLALLLLSSWQNNATLKSTVRGRDAEMAKLLLKLFALQQGGEAVGGVAVPIWRHEAVGAS